MNSDDPVVIVNARSRELLLTVQEFADRVRAHPLTIYRLIREERLDGVIRVGGRIRIDAAVALMPDQS